MQDNSFFAKKKEDANELIDWVKIPFNPKGDNSYEGVIVAKLIVHTPLCKATLCNPLPRRGMGYGGMQGLVINKVDRVDR